jgi:hypothetical protein
VPSDEGEFIEELNTAMVGFGTTPIVLISPPFEGSVYAP